MQRWIRKLFPTISSRPIVCREHLSLIVLEDRATPTVSASQVGGLLTITLDAANDGVSIGGVFTDGKTVNVRNLPGTLNQNFSNVTDITITNTTGDSTVPQQVLILDAAPANNFINLSGAFKVNAINTVTLKNPNNPLKASSITINSRFLTQSNSLPMLDATKISITAAGTGDAIGSSANPIRIVGGSGLLATNTSAGNGNQFLDFGGSANIRNVDGTFGQLNAGAVAPGKGFVTITNGQLFGLGNNDFSDTTGFVLGTGAVMTVFKSETIGALLGSGSVGASAGGTQTLVVGGANQTSTFDGSLKDVAGTPAGPGGILALATTGTGTFTLNGANTFTGGTTVKSGSTLRLIGDQALTRLAAKSNVTVESNGTFILGNSNTTSTVANSINLTLNGGKLQLGEGAVTSFHVHLGNVVFNNGGTILKGSDIQPFVGTNLFINGNLSVTGNADPSIDLPHGLGFGPNSVIDVAAGRTLTTSSTTGLFNVDYSATNDLIKQGAGTLVVNGPINLSKNGTGNKANLTTTAGTVLINGTMANGLATNDVVVNGTGAVGGKGTIAGTVLVQSGGKLLPGDPTNAATLSTGGVTFQTGSFYGVKINGTAAGEFDALNVVGTVDLGNATLFLADSVAATGPITIIANDGTEAITNTFTGIPEGGTVAGAKTKYIVSYKGGDGNDVTLTPATTPTPTTFTVDVATDVDDKNTTPGNLSLREAIRLANEASPTADTIQFAASLSGQTITLNGTELPTITDALTITAPAGGVTINGAGKSRAFRIDDGKATFITVNLSNLTFTNFMSSDGGAIDINENVTISGSTFFANTATSSGGAFAINDGTTNLINSTVSGNSALANGGGINVRVTGNLVVTNSTIVLNLADIDGSGDGIGGGISYFPTKGTITLTNTIVAGNTLGKPGASIAHDLSGVISNTSTNNVIGDAKTAGGLTNDYNATTNTGNQVGFAIGDVINTTLADNGGPSKTHSVPLTSPAIGTASVAAATKTDQRGLARPTPTRPTFIPEVGAFEVQVADLTVTTLPDATVGIAYPVQQLVANFPNQPSNIVYTFTGTPPDGLTLSNDGKITGTPTTKAAGKATFAVSATTNTGDVLFPTNVTITINGTVPSTPTDSNAAANTVAEGAANGTLVGLTVSSSATTAVTYSLTDDAGGRFAIDANTGVVSVAKSTLLDFETATSHNVTAKATTGAGTNTTTFTIAITNVNPTAPTDTDAAANTVNVGAANGATVGVTANATDPNGPVVTYTLTDDAGGRFTIDTNTGVVTVANTASITTAGNVNITVRASDGKGGTTDSTFTIAVTKTAPLPVDQSIVTNAGDVPVAGKVTLREAIAFANATAGPNTITFASGLGPITLTAGELLLTDTAETKITGPTTGTQVITRSGATQFGIFNIAANATASMSGLTITNGSSVFGGGVNNAGTLTIVNSTFSGNTASKFGGGVFNGGTLTISASTFNNNSAAIDGGGIASSGTATLANLTISANSAANLGGGIDNVGTLTGTNLTVVLNKAGTGGGGVFTSDNGTKLINTIVAGNLKGSTADDINGKLVSTSTNNFIGDPATAGGLTFTFTSNVDGSNPTGNIVGAADPADNTKLLPLSSILNTTLADNGGQTKTHALVFGNNPTIGTASKVSTVDQRGFPRPTPSRPTFNPEIGAFEIQVADLATKTLPAGKVGVAYTQQLSASFLNQQPPSPTFSFTVDPSTPLPAGLSLSSKGVIAGTPTTSGNFTVSIAASTLTGDIVLPTEVTIVIAGSGTTSGPSPTLLGSKQFAAGSDVGGSTVTFYNSDGSARFTLSPFGGATGGVRTATADFNRDGTADLVVGTGPGRSTQVKIFDGVTKAELFTVDPFEASFTGGVYVSAGDVNGDGVPDLAITPDEGGGPRVDVYSGASFGKFVSFFGIDDPNFRGGARSAISDMTGDGTADLIVVAGFGGGPRVAGFDGKSLTGTPSRIFADFFAFELILRNGVFVTAGDLNGDGFAELIVGGGPGGGPRVLAFDGKNLIQNQYVNVANYFGGDVNNRGGIRIAVKDLDGDNRADIVTGSGAGAGSRITTYLGKNISPNGTPATQQDFDAFAGFSGGVFVG